MTDSWPLLQRPEIIAYLGQQLNCKYLEFKLGVLVYPTIKLEILCKYAVSISKQPAVYTAIKFVAHLSSLLAGMLHNHSVSSNVYRNVFLNWLHCHFLSTIMLSYRSFPRYPLFYSVCIPCIIILLCIMLSVVFYCWCPPCDSINQTMSFLLSCRSILTQTSVIYAAQVTTSSLLYLVYINWQLNILCRMQIRTKTLQLTLPMEISIDINANTVKLLFYNYSWGYRHLFGKIGQISF